MRTPEAWSHKGAVSTMLLPASWLYGHGTAWRVRKAPRVRMPVPVVCVGNITAGGSGKTPVTLSLATRLLEQGHRPAFLTRGYGGRLTGPTEVDPDRHTAHDVGDEPLLLARLAPTFVARDRVAGAEAAVTEGAEILLMDDGHQNSSVYKDLSLVVIDGGFGFGNGRLLPAGPLRETVRRGVGRADAVIMIGDDRTGATNRIGSPPQLEARFMPTEGALALQGERVVAFAGIGRPEKFFETVRELGADVLETLAYPDHHMFPETEIMFICELAHERGAQPVCTEKDYVRLPPDARAMVTPVPVTLEWRNPSEVDRLLAPFLVAGTGKQP